MNVRLLGLIACFFVFFSSACAMDFYPLGNIQMTGDKRDPETFYSNYRDFDYFIIIEQKIGSKRKIDNIFELPHPMRWVSLGDVNFRKNIDVDEIIEYINNRELLVKGKFSPENVEVFLMKK